MDKGKNRTDLLVAGRKKLQQFRQKKDHKGSNSHGKSSQKASKPEKDADAEMVPSASVDTEPVAVDADEATNDSLDPSVMQQPVDLSASPSVIEADDGVFEPAKDLEELPDALPDDSGDTRVAVALDDQEAYCSGSDQRNGESLGIGMSGIENGGDRTDECNVGVVLAAEGMEEEPVAIVSVEPEASQEVDGFWVAIEENHEGEGDQVTSNGIMEVGFLGTEIGRDEKATTSEDHVLDADGIKEDNATPVCVELQGAQEATKFSVPAEEIQEAEANLAGEPMATTSHEENLEVPSPSEGVAIMERKDGDIIVNAEGETQNNGRGRQKPYLAEYVKVESEKVGELPEGGIMSHGEKVEGVKEEDRLFPLKLVEPITSGLWSLENSVPWEGDIADRFESFKRNLYLTTVANDFLQLQLAEQNKVHVEFDKHSSDEVSKLCDLVKETQESKAMVSEELAQCRSELRAMASEKEELEIRCISTKEEITELNNRACELQSKLERSQEELVLISAELDECRGLSGALQMENSNLFAKLTSETNMRKKLEEEKEFFSSENLNLTSEFSEQKRRSLIALDKQVQLEADLIQTVACFEQLTEENLYLSSSLGIHEAKIRELVDMHCELPFQARESRCQANGSDVENMVIDNAAEGSELSYKNCSSDVNPGTVEKSEVLCHVDGPLVWKVDGKDFGDSGVFGVLKGRLEETKRILQDLERAIQVMHSHSVSLSGSGGRGAASGVSKLIQAFESKVQYDDSVLDEVPPTERDQSAESHTLTKEQTRNLRAILNQMDIDLGQVEVFFMEEQNSRKLARELEVECETQWQRNNNLEAKIDELFKRLTEYKSKIDNLQFQLSDIHQSADDKAGRVFTQVESLQKEVHDKASILMQDRDYFKDAISKSIEKLDASTGLLVSDNLEVCSHFTASLNAAIEAIGSLHEKLEAAHLNYNTVHTSYEELSVLSADMQGRKELAIRLVNKVYSSLRELVNDSYQNAEEAETDLKSEEVLDLLPETYEMLIGQLRKFLDERLQLHSTNNELRSQLLNRNHEIEQLKRTSDALAKKLKDTSSAKDGVESTLMNKSVEIEELNRRFLALSRKLTEHKIFKDSEAVPELEKIIEDIVKSDNTESDFGKPLLFCLEALVAFLVQRYEEAIEQVKLSKAYILEVCSLPELSADSWSLPLPTLLRKEFGPKVIELSELQDKLQLLSASNLERENKMQILKETSSKMEEDLEVARSELHVKVTELEQSEQRLFSVREKLSIAVAKGKGLIVQRDSLKQSVVEKSSELEKCSQELLSKEAMLHEVEAKLKSYSEVERVEALESELSYIRNSATALRDSFLLKDSVLQRIEEVLEDLDLPESFHSRDIVEKIEWLARLVAGNSSFPTADWDHKSSMGGSQSDAGFVVMDAWKEDLQLSSNPGYDDLRRRYEELQSKFYGLAEHNDMLEQSLMERNSLVQKWEEVLERIDMPLQFRTMEPEDKIEWLGSTLSEVQHERDSLQLKIENLEVSSDLFIADLEESQKKISELSAEIVAVKCEKEFLSESLDNLRREYLGLSEKAVEDELERSTLRKEISDMQEKLVEKVEKKDYLDVVNKIRKLLDLVISALPESDRPAAPGSSDSECLEGLLTKLIDNYTTLSSEKSVDKIAEKECITEESNLFLDKKPLKDVLDDKEQGLVVLRLELDETLHNLGLVKEERDAATEKCRSLMLEIEALGKQKDMLEDERTTSTERYQSLVLEVEAMSKRRDALQEQLTQEEQRSASAREKLNVAVRKGKGLVQQRDSLKQTIEEMNTLVEHLKNEHNQRVESLESENLILTNRLAEAEWSLQDNSRTLSSLLTALHAVDIGSEVEIIDPVQKMEGIGKLSHDLRAAVASSEHEAHKSRRAAELLLDELNEVQERNDRLQEELVETEATLATCSRQKYVAEAARMDALSRLEQFMAGHFEESKKQVDKLMELKSDIDHLREGWFSSSNHLANIIKKDVDLFCHVETFMESILKQIDGANVADLPVFGSSSLLSSNPISKEKLHTAGAISGQKLQEHFDDSMISERLALVDRNLYECMREVDDLQGKFLKHSFTVDQQATRLLKIMGTIQRKIASQKEFSESLKRDVAGLELMIKEKEAEICLMRGNVTLLYEACSSSIIEIENRKAEINGNRLVPGEHVLGNGMVLRSPSCIDWEEPADGYDFPFTEDRVRTVVDTLLSTVKGSSNIQEIAEGNHRELKANILDLQRELQEKDIQMNRICAELVSQIREAESTAKRHSIDLDSAKTQVCNLERQAEVIENDRRSLELKVNELIVWEATSKELQERVKSLTNALTSKDQEIEGLMQALDEEESQMEVLEYNKKELEKIVQEKNLALDSLEASRAKAVAKLSTTMTKFDELHHLSESLLTEVENLQSQLQERDSEISFLRQEVTRCTNDVLAVQENNKKDSTEVHELLKWMVTMVSRFGVHDVHLDDQKGAPIFIYTDVLDKKIASIMAELDDLRVTAQGKDALLQIERDRVEELLRKIEVLEVSREKESPIDPFRGMKDSGQPANMSSQGSLEIEQVRNQGALGPITPHVRGGRKVNSDQIAIAIDTEQNGNLLDDDDDDKAHGFKSLTMSRIVPKATRSIADRIDGIWVSGDRLLMRQPTLRLGFLIYWVALHALLVSFI